MNRYAGCALLLLALVLSGHANSQNWPKLDDSIDQRRFVRCVLSTEQSTWSKDSDTVVRVRLANASSSPIDLEVFPVVYLKTKAAQNRWEIPLHYWAPADLKKDAPAPIKNKSGSITPQKQVVHLTPKGESEFILHASNIKWDLEASSAWPAGSLFGRVEAGEYELYLELDDAVRSNSAVVRVTPEKRAEGAKETAR